MGKTTVPVRLWNFLDNARIRKGEITPLELEAQIDNGSVRVVLPKSIAEHLKLEIRGSVNVRYADMRKAKRDVAFGLMVEIMGRETVTTAIIEPRRTVPLIGQIVLEDLDLWIDSKNGKLIPNPESPDVPLLDEF